jgi:hypothetical protein
MLLMESIKENASLPTKAREAAKLWLRANTGAWRTMLMAQRTVLYIIASRGRGLANVVHVMHKDGDCGRVPLQLRLGLWSRRITSKGLGIGLSLSLMFLVASAMAQTEGHRFFDGPGVALTTAQLV